MINMVLLSGFEPIFIDHYKYSSQLDINELKKKIDKHKDEIGAVLVTSQRNYKFKEESCSFDQCSATK